MRNGLPLLSDAGLAPLVKQYPEEFFVARFYDRRPRWLAPEILLSLDDGPTYTLQTDVYALAMTVLEVLTGHAPYHPQANENIVAYRVARGILPSRPISSTITDNIWNLITTCLSMNSRDRPTAACVDSCLEIAHLSQILEQ
jgi:serine/threonine protein kinase